MLPDRNKQHAKSSYGEKFRNEKQQKKCMNYILQTMQTSNVTV
jgi:hypothetical protein